MKIKEKLKKILKPIVVVGLIVGFWGLLASLPARADGGNPSLVVTGSVTGGPGGSGLSGYDLGDYTRVDLGYNLLKFTETVKEIKGENSSGNPIYGKTWTKTLDEDKDRVNYWLEHLYEYGEDVYNRMNGTRTSNISASDPYLKLEFDVQFKSVYIYWYDPDTAIEVDGKTYYRKDSLQGKTFTSLEAACNAWNEKQENSSFTTKTADELFRHSIQGNVSYWALTGQEEPGPDTTPKPTKTPTVTPTEGPTPTPTPRVFNRVNVTLRFKTKSGNTTSSVSIGGKSSYKTTFDKGMTLNVYACDIDTIEHEWDDYIEIPYALYSGSKTYLISEFKCVRADSGDFSQGYGSMQKKRTSVRSPILVGCLTPIFPL